MEVDEERVRLEAETSADPVTVSLGMPVYNGEAFVENAIKGVLAQSFGDYELIISDNASTDRTREICLDYARQDARITYVRQPENLGAVPNFRQVFELSRGRYFKWTAVDDRCHRTYLEKAVRMLESNPSAVWCHSRSSHIDANGVLLEEAGSQNVSYPERQSFDVRRRFRSVLLGKGGCHDTFGLIRREALGKTPLFLPCYGAEKVLIAELALLGDFVEIPETLFFSGVVDQASSNMRTAAEQQEFISTRRTWKTSFTRLTLLAGYLSAIRRSAPGVHQRMICLTVVLQWLFQVSKWRDVLLKTLRREGLGGRNIERLRRMNNSRGGGQTC
ncbi:MAG: glycosyltransferase family 2 protein [Pseudomonadota bacterium]